MEEQYARTRLLLGDEAQEHLKGCTVAVFGLGGVGSFAAEALARAGIGRMILVDRDVVTISNLNRQLVALHSTLGRPNAEVMRERILDINPACRAEAKQVFYLPQSSTSPAARMHSLYRLFPPWERAISSIPPALKRRIFMRPPDARSAGSCAGSSGRGASRL